MVTAIKTLKRMAKCKLMSKNFFAFIILNFVVEHFRIFSGTKQFLLLSLTQQCQNRRHSIYSFSKSILVYAKSKDRKYHHMTWLTVSTGFLPLRITWQIACSRDRIIVEAKCFSRRRRPLSCEWWQSYNALWNLVGVTETNNFILCIEATTKEQIEIKKWHENETNENIDIATDYYEINLSPWHFTSFVSHL